MPQCLPCYFLRKAEKNIAVMHLNALAHFRPLSAVDDDDDAVEAAPTDAGVDSFVEGLLISPRSGPNTYLFVISNFPVRIR